MIRDRSSIRICNTIPEKVLRASRPAGNRRERKTCTASWLQEAAGALAFLQQSAPLHLPDDTGHLIPIEVHHRVLDRNLLGAQSRCCPRDPTGLRAGDGRRRRRADCSARNPHHHARCLYASHGQSEEAGAWVYVRQRKGEAATGGTRHEKKKTKLGKKKNIESLGGGWYLQGSEDIEVIGV